MNAIAQTVVGKGFESSSYGDVAFLDLANIHVVRKAYKSIARLARSGHRGVFGKTAWIEQMTLTLSATRLVVRESSTAMTF